MDTDDLTAMAYDCIRHADEATEVLKTELGAACSKFKTEDEYLLGILMHVKSIERNPEAYLDEWNLLGETNINVFKMKIRQLREHIEKAIKTPLNKRGKPQW